jgi:hypothetical protein
VSSLKETFEYGFTIEQMLKDRGYSEQQIKEYKKRKALKLKKMMQK